MGIKMISVTVAYTRQPDKSYGVVFRIESPTELNMEPTEFAAPSAYLGIPFALGKISDQGFYDNEKAEGPNFLTAMEYALLETLSLFFPNINWKEPEVQISKEFAHYDWVGGSVTMTFEAESSFSSL